MTNSKLVSDRSSIGQAPLQEGHPDLESARVRVAVRRLVGHVSDILKTDEELIADELLAAKVRRTEAAAKEDAARQLAAAHRRGVQQALAVAPPAGQIPTEKVQRFQSLKRRRIDLLTPLIRNAQVGCKDPYSTAEVWPKLQQLAAQRQPPFLGVTDEGLKYNDQSDQVRFLTKRNLKDRLRR